MNNSTTPKQRIPPDIPDIFTDPMQLTIPTIPQNRKGKEKASEQSTQLEAEISYSLVNHLLKILLESEKDKDIQIAVQQQLVILDAIKEFKVQGKKEKLIAISSKQVEQKTAENAVISQLQKQVENLEKSVENKFSLILKSIETKSQEQLQNQSQIQAQNQAQFQTQIQSSNGTKSYAQAAADNSQIEENNSQTVLQKKQQKQQEKQQEKELEKQKYREKRLIIQVEKEVAESFNSYQIRNQINDRFFTKENINLPVIATVTKSFTSQSIILTTMPDFSADFLLQKKTVWEDIFSNKAQKIEKDAHWSKVVVHGIPVEPFSMDEGLSLLKEEIETFNPGLKLLKKPIWLSSQDKRQANRHASILIAVENAKQAQLAIEKRLCIAGNYLIAEKCKENIVYK